ncbi:hypothetical protein [Lysinibacillus sp. FSL K6-3209]|uniref:hypothetical protein n=1 Tax=Lysinibacillus sp. FSL K6-3209 TaxID=2921497 RepID=UPI0030D9712A
MDKTLEQKLKDFDKLFKEASWNTQIKILNSLGLIDSEYGDEDNLEIDRVLEEVIFDLSDFYLKNNMDTLRKFIENNLDESILKNAFKKYLDNKWGLREHSLKVLNLENNEIHFIIEEIINTMTIKRIHRSPNIIMKTVNKNFNKEYNKDTIWDIVTFFDYLIEFFVDNNHTYNSFKRILNKETLLSPEIIELFFNLLQKYQSDIEKAYILAKISEG